LRRNALSYRLMESFKDNLLSGVKEPELRVIIVSANGPVFCSGHDLGELVSEGIPDLAHCGRVSLTDERPVSANNVIFHVTVRNG